MKTITGFVKKYWITALIFVGLVFTYYYVADVKKLNPYLFPATEKIVTAFMSNKHEMLTNMFASFRLLIPSVIISLVVAVVLGTIMGMNKKIREVLHPVIYAFSVIPSILLSPFVLLLSPSLFSASVFLVVYNIVAALFATIAGIMTIDKRYLDKAATLELTGVKRFVKVILPAASPSILAGFVNSLRSSFVMLVFAEMYGGGSGMGYFVKKEFRTWSICKYLGWICIHGNCIGGCEYRYLKIKNVCSSGQSTKIL